MGVIIKSIKFIGRAYVWSIFGGWRATFQRIGELRSRMNDLVHQEYRSETFDEAVSRLQISESHLHRRHDWLLLLSGIYALVAVVALIFLCLTSYSPHPVNHAILSFGVLLVGSAKFLEARFRVAQIRAGKLFGFTDWLFMRTGG